MDNLGILYRFECRKLFQKKIVWLCLIFSAACILCGCLFEVYVGDVYIDGKRFESNYEATQKDFAYAKALDGQPIDQALIEKTVAAYRTIPQDIPGHYIGTEEYQKNARPYSAIFNILYRTSNMLRSELMYTWEPDAEDYYRMYRACLEDRWDRHYLTGEEKTFWAAQWDKVEKPIFYREYATYDKMLTMYQTVGIVTLLTVTVCLAGAFPDEHSRRTDQLNLCAKNGRKALYWAKILSGITFGIGTAAGYALIELTALLLLYGPGHFSAPFQLICEFYAGPMNCGQGLLIACGILILTAVLYAVLVMAVSERTRSSVATLSVGAVLIILGELMVIPSQYRFASQLWDWMPFSFLNIWNVFGDYTVDVFGARLTAWQAVPILYILAGGLTALLSKRTYGRFQAVGR